VYNPYIDTVDVTVSDILVSIDGYDFTVIRDGQWDKSVPTGYTTFEGYITIDNTTYSDLVKKSPVDIDITGNIRASGQYRWIERHMTRVFNIPISPVDFK
jgi:hypothetical protein